MHDELYKYMAVGLKQICDPDAVFKWFPYPNNYRRLNTSKTHCKGIYDHLLRKEKCLVVSNKQNLTFKQYPNTPPPPPPTTTTTTTKS